MTKWSKKTHNMAGCFIWLLPCLTLTLSACNEPRKTLAEKPEKILAKVNGTPIVEYQIAMELHQELRKHKNLRAGSTGTAKKNALKKVIEQELLYQASQAQTLNIPDMGEKAEETLQSIQTRLGSEERFQDYLKSYNLSAGQILAITKRKLAMDEYLKSQGLVTPQISEEEVRSFYEQMPFKRDESLHLKHILLSVEEGTAPAEKDKIYQKAEELRQMIVDGADFAELAKEHSDSSEVDGDLGYIKRDYMPAAFDEVVFSLKKGEVSAVFETQFGYHIAKLMDKRPAGKTPYGEVRDFIKRYLQNQRKPQMIAAHIEELRNKANIEIFDEN
ncbi:MAG TPA: hypothetical protein ENI94_11150 [Gammaproteobacteria bacterium]|nr:hypothetical protein [Gammaproteobacteria bacterium]